MLGTHVHKAVRVLQRAKLLWHGTSVYNGHLRGPVPLTPVAERLAAELSLPVFTTLVCRDRGSKPDLPHAMRTLYLYANCKVNKFTLKVRYIVCCLIYSVFLETIKNITRHNCGVFLKSRISPLKYSKPFITVLKQCM